MSEHILRISGTFSVVCQRYLALCKINVVLLMLITALVGGLLATDLQPDLMLLSVSLTGIGLLAASGAAFNHVIDLHRDEKMARTQHRPLVRQQLTTRQGFLFASALGLSGFWLLFWFTNITCALLTLASMVGYALLYTRWLKPRTPQNITIGGLAGAMPPLLGWVAMTDTLHPMAWLLVLIIFTWTPPHFWSLAFYRREDYRKAGLPMLSVTHGNHFTSLHILLYTFLLIPVTLLPWISGYSGVFYAVLATLLNLRFIQLAIHLIRSQSMDRARETFRYSIQYLFVLFIVLLGDRLISVL